MVGDGESFDGWVGIELVYYEFWGDGGVSGELGVDV